MPVPGPASKSHTQAWDVVVRVLHWSLAVIVGIELIRDDGDLVHRVIGYVGVGIVAARLLWSMVTRGHGRMALLKPSARVTLSYTRSLMRGDAPRQNGHDPLGLWMVWLLWILVLLLGLTGWMTRLDMFWGDERVQNLHAWLADAMLAAVVVHLTGVAVMSWLWRENLPASMVTGRKREVDRSS